MPATDNQRSEPPRTDLVRVINPGPSLRAMAAAGGDSGRTMHGHLLTWDTWVEINDPREGHFMERVLRGATRKTFGDKTPKVLYDHGWDPTIGRKPLGRITALAEDETGAYFEVELSETSYNADLVALLEDGQLGTSYSFSIPKDRVDYVPNPGVSAHNPMGLPEQTIRELAISEFGPTPLPWNEAATAGVRSRTSATQETRRTGQDGLYKRAAGFVSSAAWLIHKDTLATITSILRERQEGVRLSAEEIAERIGTRAQPAEAPAGGGVAVITIAGPIVPRAGMIDQTSSELRSVEGIQQEFRAAMADPAVAAVLLNIDSPGGSSDLIPELGAEIFAARGRKPIVAVANTFAASAAYWLAAQADELLVTPSGEVGSIGVYAAHQDVSKAMADKGVKTSFITADIGPHKVDGNPFEPLSDRARADIQRKVDAIGAEFVAAVAKGRGVSEKTVLADFGKGNMLMAVEAVAAGMADGVETFDSVLARLVAEHAPPAAAENAGTSNGSRMEIQIAWPNIALQTLPVGGATFNADSSAGDASTTRSLAPEPATRATTQGTAPETTVHHPATPVTVKSNVEVEKLTIEEMAQRRAEIAGQMRQIAADTAGERRSEEQKVTWAALIAEDDDLSARIQDDEQMRADIAARAGNDANESGDGARAAAPLTSVGATNGIAGKQIQTNRGRKLPADVFALEQYDRLAGNLNERATMIRDGARTAVDMAVIAHPNADEDQAKRGIERLLEKDKDGELAHRILVTGSRTYAVAFGKAMTGRSLSPEEQRALSIGGSGGADGGYAVPFQIDTTLILVSDGVINPFRQLARVEQTLSNQFKFVTSGEVTAAYQDELAIVVPNQPTLGQPTAYVEKAQAEIDFSIEIGEDWQGFQAQMAVLLSDAKDTLEAQKMLDGLGHGSHVPEGILTGATTTVPTAGNTSASFGPEDLRAVKRALPPRFKARAAWLANEGIYDIARGFGEDSGADVWQPSLQEGNPDKLLGKPAYEHSLMDEDATAGNSIAVYGDWKQFAIVDRIGMSIELIPHKPVIDSGALKYKGQRALYCYWRNTSKVLTPNAFRVLVVETS